jgi:hemoglobin
MSGDLPTPYERLGGTAAVRTLVERFYDLMDALPEAHEVRKLHPADLAQSREKLYMFLSGWLGGPPLYERTYGHPRLRARHLPFSIGTRERDQWLLCMSKALDTLEIDRALRFQLEQSFFKTADFMRNQTGGN